MKRMFSGIQPTGQMHIGNYFGALIQWLNFQKKFECIFSIVDYHAITVDYDPDQMRKNKIEMAVSLLAAGLDPKKSIVFFQSDVPEHTELAWILSSLTILGQLERMTQFKDKYQDDRGSANAGFFSYPILQAADILLYKAQTVPVGRDQTQHLELTREIARKFNSKFGVLFPEPEATLSPSPKILGTDGKAKMSKSKGNTIPMNASPEDIQKILKPAFTDPQRLRRSDPGNPEVCNIWSLHKLVQTEKKVDEIAKACRTAAIGCGECKQDLGNALAKYFEPFRVSYEEWNQRGSDAYDIFVEGGKRARKIAMETMAEVRDRMGLRPGTY